ncbi:MAG: transglycosylase SLT domain-containing protein [Bacteriovoracaceae bacterium]|nr:transglycosylase SLT domain-containing protein [Bacteriovoracaceae bacterium]
MAKLRHIKQLVKIVVVLTIVGCAGPMTPFGAYDIPQDQQSSKSLKNQTQTSSIPPSYINVYPEKLILHRPIDLRVVVNNPGGIDSEAQINITYNKKPIPKKYIKRSKKLISKDGKTLNLIFKNIRFIPGKFNKLEVSYTREDGQSFMKSVGPGHCSMYTAQDIKHWEHFKVPDEIKGLIKSISKKEKYGASFLAALIAQESSFNPKAVSWSKAIGLTQVTSIAEQEIFFKKKMRWPRYYRLNKLPVYFIKSYIKMGIINNHNEWRLNPKLSIEGGIRFLDYLNGYWSYRSNRKLLEKTFKNHAIPKEQIILASYNSGAYRVKKAIELYGKDWALDPKLVEAKKYYQNILSYCYTFEKSSELAYE